MWNVIGSQHNINQSSETTDIYYSNVDPSWHVPPYSYSTKKKQYDDQIKVQSMGNLENYYLQGLYIYNGTQTDAYYLNTLFFLCLKALDSVQSPISLLAT